MKLLLLAEPFMTLTLSQEGCRAPLHPSLPPCRVLGRIYEMAMTPDPPLLDENAASVPSAPAGSAVRARDPSSTPEFRTFFSQQHKAISNVDPTQFHVRLIH